MPHVVLTGELDVHEVFRKLEKVFHKDNDCILKTGARYIESEGKAIVIEAAVIEKSAPRDIMILISKRDDGLVVRLHPSLDVEKTDGVKMTLALVARQIKEKFPGTVVGKTNLQDFL